MKKANFKDILIPTISLFLICLVITAALATLLPTFTQLWQDLSASAVMNALRWETFGKSTDVSAIASAYASECGATLSFITARAAALTPGFSENRAFLYYEPNGGRGKLVEAQVHVLGDSVTVKDKGSGDYQVYAPDAYDTLDYWNTKPDGTGTSYKPGDTFVLEQECTVLYAQYRKMNSTERAGENARTFWQKIKDFFVKMWKAFVSIFD